MTGFDTSRLSPEVAAYIRSLETRVEKIEALETEVAALREENQQQKNQLLKMQSLNEQLVNLRRRTFGRSSEKVQYVDGEQLDFFNEAETCSDAGAPEPGKTTPVKAHTRKEKRTKAELTEGLEHKKVLCELPEDQQLCARCGNKMVRIGEKYLRSELIIIPAQVSVVDYYAASYKCVHCEQETGESYILQAQAPVPVMKKSMAAPSTVAYVMQEKFEKGVPLYRQEQYWKEMSQMWVYCSPEKKIALYQYHPSRKGQVAKEMLGDFSGYLQTDGYSGYHCLDRVTHVGCWAHARRKWVDCFVDGKPVAGSKSETAFQLIEQMFQLEQTWEDTAPEERRRLRSEKLKPILDRYWEYLASFEAAEGTALYKAQNYSLNQKQALDAVLLDGRLELTNNLAERTVKPFVMARRNFLFCDTAKGADASALCFSVIETAKRNGLDPFGYLMFLLQELPKLGPDPAEEQLLPLLPWSPDLPGYCKIKQ